MFYYLIWPLGKLLSRIRAGDSELITNLEEFRDVPMSIEITSEEIKDDFLAEVTTPRGGSKSPSLEIVVPNDDSIKSLVLVCQDIDPPMPHPATHLVAYNVPKLKNSFKLGELNYLKDSDPSPMKFGYGSLRTMGYIGPGPPPGHGAHRYIFQVFAVNEVATRGLNEIERVPNKDEVVNIIKGNTICMGQIVGNYTND